MTLKDRITDDMKTAMRAKETERLSTIRMLLAAIKQKEVDERITVDDAQAVALVDKLIKQRKDSVAAYQQAGRADLADKENAEIAVLQAYLPARLSADEVAAEVRAIVAELGASGPGDMGKVMGAAKAKLAGKAEMAAVSAAVKQALSQ
ncbi:GatB/YqeY domain-containing protein [Aquincola tertiaricarbonis]|uniref:GatB/YqeY domain-containing protein n=1 Tax=Aquincola tertiaricarbonis TaxID=391953 RepID=A0ABY4SFD6_AQUTE|nr:GatB/YqeY domain-containing protein [Aquincola tertiaricarbonis]URI11698.1 GatB/YqeY domain-containing protein [Aquincola tertiaricarbonis]